jgi:UDP-N-acetyl-D-mannosaminuronic acid dehydrogenase
MKTICVSGLGYIGLPTACLLATHGFQVIGVEPKKDVRDKINKAETPFEEPGLDLLVKRSSKARQPHRLR